MAAIVGIDDDMHGGNAGMPQQPLDGMAEQRRAADGTILLGQASTGAKPLAGGNDKGVDGHAARSSGLARRRKPPAGLPRRSKADNGRACF